METLSNIQVIYYTSSNITSPIPNIYQIWLMTFLPFALFSANRRRHHLPPTHTHTHNIYIYTIKVALHNDHPLLRRRLWYKDNVTCTRCTSLWYSFVSWGLIYLSFETFLYKLHIQLYYMCICSIVGIQHVSMYSTVNLIST